MKYYKLDDKTEFINKDCFINLYNHKYFTEYSQNDYELEDHIEKNLKEGTLDFYCIAWKMGRKPQDYLEKYANGDAIPNGYGKPIKRLNDYISYIQGEKEALVNLINDKDKPRESLEKVFESLSKEAPDNFGTVYIFTIIYFLSKGNLPIYDQFAHKAVKAIFLEKKPEEIYVGSAPSKKETKNAINMFDEYRWYLEQVFGTSSIPRIIDRALWTYGHN